MAFPKPKSRQNPVAYKRMISRQSQELQSLVERAMQSAGAPTEEIFWSAQTKKKQFQSIS